MRSAVKVIAMRVALGVEKMLETHPAIEQAGAVPVDPVRRFVTDMEVWRFSFIIPPRCANETTLGWLLGSYQLCYALRRPGPVPSRAGVRADCSVYCGGKAWKQKIS